MPKSIFQFHKGTIKTCEDPRKTLRVQNFNSIKVQLRRSVYRSIGSQMVYFNSIKVQLRPLLERQRLYTDADFNSIKVQLRLDSNASTENAELFQFHKGTIKT